MSNKTRFEYMGYVIQREGRDWVVYDWDDETGLVLKYYSPSRPKCLAWADAKCQAWVESGL